jgi:hypothetical protein
MTDAVLVPEESNASPVSWGAIAAAGIASAAFSLFLANLLAGLGLAVVSPWTSSGPSTTTFQVGGGIALVLMAVMASALGGYLAGRLRTKWVGLRSDEVFFRDTAHGLLAWAFGTLITASVLAEAAGALVTSFGQGAAANPALVPDRNSYYVDMLFRSNRPTSVGAETEASSAEAGRILGRGLAVGSDIEGIDRIRLAQLIAQRTGLSQVEASLRVDTVITQ